MYYIHVKITYRIDHTYTIKANLPTIDICHIKNAFLIPARFFNLIWIKKAFIYWQLVYVANTIQISNNYLTIDNNNNQLH